MSRDREAAPVRGVFSVFMAGIPSSEVNYQATTSLDHYKLCTAHRDASEGSTKRSEPDELAIPQAALGLSLNTASIASPGEWSLLGPSCPPLGQSKFLCSKPPHLLCP